jgi:hypothetical protein
MFSQLRNRLVAHHVVTFNVQQLDNDNYLLPNVRMATLTVSATCPQAMHRVSHPLSFI